MSDAEGRSASHFWSFSLAVYGNHAVAAACIALQDRCGLDVNLLLFALFAGSRGRTLSRTDYERVESAVAPWRENVVWPLREIESEEHQQRQMESVLPIREGSPDVGAAADNLLRYLERSSVSADQSTISDLAMLLNGAFTSLDGAKAKALLGARWHARGPPGAR